MCSRTDEEKKVDAADVDRGFSLTQIIEQLSQMYGIQPSKGFKRQVVAALRRGVDYGILVKAKSRYRYDPELSLLNSLRKRARGRRGPAMTATSRRKRPAPSKQYSPREPDHERGDSPDETKPRVQPSVPRPTVPPPPDFQQKPRNLSSEPLTRVIKHQRTPQRKY
ncbi:uncharacterized protein LOC111694318 [Trichogramma pretiosum]|uniref:uncharacterized protein LOC111694318 n=1 Tax=Trichogramma pretiosum TaxID=7493 RepID=UPI000C719098|nr:uncharacterized protein LOC111694318 [Trichogramma pretiosum]